MAGPAAAIPLIVRTAIVDQLVELGSGVTEALGGSIQDLATETLVTVAAFEQLRLRLTTLTGSSEASELVFDNLKDLSRETPLEIAELAEAFIQFSQNGIRPTNELMKSLGNIARGSDADFGDVVDAAIAAVHGQADALQEFGINVQDMGETVRITTGKQALDVEDNAASIAAALQQIGNEDFAGSMERFSGSFEGATLNLQNAINDIADSAARETGALNEATSAAQLAIDGLNSVRTLTVPDTDQEIEDLNQRIRDNDLKIESLELQASVVDFEPSAGNIQIQLKDAQQTQSELQDTLDELILQSQRGSQLITDAINNVSLATPPASADGETTRPPVLGDEPSLCDCIASLLEKMASPLETDGLPAEPVGLRVEPSLCDCIASLIERNRSPFAADGLPSTPPLIDGQVQGDAQGVGAPVTAETVDTLIAADDAATNYVESLGNILLTSQQAQEVSQLFGNAAATAMAQIRDGSFSAADALDSLLDRLFQILVIAPLEQAITGFFQGFFNPTGPVVQSDFLGSSAIGGELAHTGGIIGVSDLPTRLMSASAAGLAADEFPAVLRQGEGVFTPEQMAAMGPAGGSGNVTVNVIDRRGTDAAPVEVTERQNNGRREIEVLILDTVSRDIGRRGSVGQAIETTFGARRQGVR